MKLSTYSTKINHAITFARVNELVAIALDSGIAPATVREIAAPRITTLRIARAAALQFSAALDAGACVTTLFLAAKNADQFAVALDRAREVRLPGSVHNSEAALYVRYARVRTALNLPAWNTL